MSMSNKPKNAKYPIVLKHFSNPTVLQPTNGNWNYQAPVVSDKPLARLIRKQVKPFAPEKGRPVDDNPTANMRKVIDFSLASLHESDKRYHCQVMFDMCERLAACFNCRNTITAEQLYTLYEIHNWTCPETKTKHSIRTPLSLMFKCHIWQGGKLAIANALPIYNGYLPGEFSWVGTPEYRRIFAA